VRVLMVPDADRAELERRARSRGAPARVAERARIVLLAAEGLTGGGAPVDEQQLRLSLVAPSSLLVQSAAAPFDSRVPFPLTAARFPLPPLP
jgi:hypothetical protein